MVQRSAPAKPSIVEVESAPGAIPLHPLTYGDTWLDPATGVLIAKTIEGNARQRLLLLDECRHSPTMQDHVKAMCAKSILFWVNLFAYTYVVQRVDPKTGKDMKKGTFDQHVQFITWPVQDAGLLELVRCVDEGEDAIVDKSRDMGASWIGVVLATWYWLFSSDSQIGVCSRIEDDVDKKGRHKSLFWKIDYLLRWLPGWMLPCPRDKLARGGDNRSHMILNNPSNGSTIAGEATTGDLFRGDRLKFAYFDEMAAQQYATAGWQSAADATNCRIGNSTPLGAGTEFTSQRNKGLETGSPVVITLGYWDHPDKGRGRDWTVDENGAITGTAGRGFYATPWFWEQTKRRDHRDLGQNVLIDHVTSGDTVFNTAVVTRHIRDFSCVGVRCEIDTVEFEPGIETPVFVPDDAGRWTVWALLDEDGRVENQDTNYVEFADPAYGTGAANAAIGVMDRESGELVAEFADPYIVPHLLAEQMKLAGRIFHGQVGHAFAGWETNGPGESMYQDMRDYPFLYYQRVTGQKHEKSTRHYGWTSTRTRKRLLCSGLNKSLMRGDTVIQSREALDELLTYVYYEDGSIGPGHLADEKTGARDAHGDRAIAVAGCVMLIAEAPHYEPEKKTYKPGSMGDIAEHDKVFSTDPAKTVDPFGLG